MDRLHTSFISLGTLGFFHLIYIHYNVHLKMQNAEKNLYKFLSESESFIHLLLSKEKLHLKMKALFNV